MPPAITASETPERAAVRRAGHPAAPARPGRFTFALSAAVLVFSLMQTLSVPALPTIGRELGASSLGTGWILTAFLLAGAVFSPVIGNLGDRFGHRRIMLIAMLVFAAATLVAAVAPNLGVLLAARVAQGVSTATFPLALALVRAELTGPRLAAAFGWIPGMIGLGAGLALVMGGLVVDALGWRWIFFIGAALILVAVAFVLAWVPSGGTGASARRTDWPGILLLAGGLVGVLLAVSQGGAWGWASPWTIGVGIAGILLLAALVVVELRSPAPVVDVRTFRHGPIVLVSLLTVVVGFVPYVFYVALPILMQAPAGTGYGHGMSVTASALAMLPSAVLVFLGGRLSPWLAARLGGGGAAVIAAAVMGIGAGALAIWPTVPWLVVVAFGVLGFGNGIGYAICSQLVVTASPANEVGAATGLNGVVRTIGSASAAPVVSALLAAAAVGASDPANVFSAAFWVAAGACVLGVVVSIGLRGTTRRTA
ncbi:MFS transporter [Agromyces seonyuensis]|uniref:MFS transporter n=1 Tax=Agromyces seonyuensis TaxID=2662446 RepID=A0A6I4NS83_9MICO|nr:MFS transporter [Agromyces seonyuensis]MWB97103.1 MFS transporter [Agromyces seonyuensis]